MASIINATTSTGLVSSADNSGSLQLATNNGTTAVTIDTSQNVGIGTTSPAAPADVVSNSNAIAVSMRGRVSDDACVIRWISNNGSTVNGRIQVNSGGDMIFQNTNSITERMRITSSGFLFVNTTSLVGDGYVSVSFNGSANVGMGLKSTHNGSFDVMRFVNYNNVQQGYINCNNSGSTTYNSGSDYRFKDNVKPMIDGLSKVMQLKPVTFNWKGDNSAGQGFIAHELAEIVPDVVSGEKDAVTEDGTIKPQGVDYGKLTAVLASAIQELNTDLANTKLLLTEVSNKVEAQAVRIAELEGAK